MDVSELENDSRDIREILINAYGFSLMILSLSAAKFQTYAYFENPVRCSYKGKNWILHEGDFREEEEWNKTQVINGGDGFCRDLSFLNKNKNPRKVLLFYREARDESKPVDYRVLQLWRFFEGWFKKKESALVNELVSLKTVTERSGWDVKTGKPHFLRYKITKRFVDRFYKYVRCAVAHGGGAKSWQSKKVYYPLLLDFEFRIEEDLDFMQKVADESLRRNTKLY